MSSKFRIDQHVVPCQHIRHYPHATQTRQEEVLQLAVKQYTPLDNLSPKEGDITIIAAHANGFPKELYEPLWEDMLSLLSKASFKIRSIWIADVAWQGESSILNEDKLGNDPSWFDHPRDLLHMINVFRDQMPRPLFGLGHSLGGNNIVNLSLMHPRLFESIILIDPVIQRVSSIKGDHMAASASSRRREKWPSRAEAEKSFKKSKFYQNWDPRVLDRWVQYGLRDLPTKLFPSASASSPSSGPEVTLRTSKHNEVLTFFRHHPKTNSKEEERSRFPDYNYETLGDSLFYRPEPGITFANLPFLRPSVLYIFGDESDLSVPERRADKMANTGVGLGGSGGAKEGRVQEVVLQKVGHLIPMEKSRETAEECVRWLDNEMVRWREVERIHARVWEKVPKGEENMLSQAYLDDMKADTEVKLKQVAEEEKRAKSKL